MILNDKQIKKLAEQDGMITPFVDKSVQDGVSYGLQTFGYDLRVGSEFKLFTNIKGNVIADPKISLRIILLLLKMKNQF